MTRRCGPELIERDDDWDDDEGDDPDAYGDESGGEGEDDDTTAPCPHCGRDIYDDAERCPQCGRYLSREDAPPGRKPWWIVAGAVAGLYVMLRWVFHAF